MKYIKTINEMLDDDGYEDREGYEIINQDEYLSIFQKKRGFEFSDNEMSEINSLMDEFGTTYTLSKNRMVASFKNDLIKITLVSKDDEYYLLRLGELVYNGYSGRNQEETTYFLCDQMSGLKNATDEIESRYLFQKRIQSDDL